MTTIHAYTIPGTFQVTLTIFDTNEFTTSNTTTATITASPGENNSFNTMIHPSSSPELPIPLIIGGTVLLAIVIAIIIFRKLYYI